MGLLPGFHPNRWRLAFITTAELALRCLLLVPSFLLVPPHTWPHTTWARYAVSASTAPLLHAFMLSLLDQAIKVGAILAVTKT